MENISNANLKDCLPSCNLTNDQMTQRKAFLENGLAKKIKHLKELSNGYNLTFEAQAETEKELLDFINFERRCCSGFSFALVFEPHNKATHLQIYGSNQIKQELSTGFQALGLITTNTLKSKTSLFSKFGLCGIGLCGLCCVLPLIGTFVGIGSFAAIAFYLDKFGIALLLSALILFIYEYFQNRLNTKSCGTSGETKCNCQTIA